MDHATVDRRQKTSRESHSDRGKRQSHRIGFTFNHNMATGGNPDTEPVPTTVGNSIDQTEVIDTIYGWISRASTALAGAESGAKDLLACVRNMGDDHSWCDSAEHWIFRTCARLECHVNEFWSLDHFIKTGILHSWRDDSAIYAPSTYRDLEALPAKTKVPLPKEMSPEWFMTALQCLAGETHRGVDFSWAPSYTGHECSPIVAPQPTPTLLRLLAESAQNEGGVGKEIAAELNRYKQIPRWVFPESRSEASHKLTSERLNGETILPTPWIVKPVLAVMSYTSGGDSPTSTQIPLQRRDASAQDTQRSTGRSQRSIASRYVAYWRNKIQLRKGRRSERPIGQESV